MKDKVKSVTYIVSNIGKALSFEWIASELDKSKFSLSFILLNPGESKLESYLKDLHLPVYRIEYRGKKDIITAFYKTVQLLKSLKTDVIHCHLFDASIIGLSAGLFCGIKKRVYTRHHSSLHHVYFPRAVYYDKLINSMASHIVAISNKVKQILVEQEGVKESKVTLIPHSFKIEEFEQVFPAKIDELKAKYNSSAMYPVVGVIARYTHWKGIQYIIPAFKSLLQIHPNALLILANASGDYTNAVKELLKDIPLKNRCEIKFEKDITALYKLFDVYVHVPIDDHSEAFGQTYVEALASGVPSVFTLSGIASEFIQHKVNAYVVPFQNSDSIYERIVDLLENNNFAQQLVDQGKKDVAAGFSLSIMIEALEELYEQ